MKPEVTSLKLGKGETWISITLPWSAVRAITTALKLVEGMEHYRTADNDILIRMGDFVLKYKKDGIVVSYSDWDSLPEVEELLDAKPEVLCATCKHADVCEMASLSVESCNFYRELELENRLAKNPKRETAEKIKEGGPDFGCHICRTSQLPDCGGKCEPLSGGGQ